MKHLYKFWVNILRRSRHKKLKFVILFIVTILVLAVIVNNTSLIWKAIYPLKYKEQVFKYASESKLDPYLIYAIMKAESGFDPKATSKKNAKGLMQLMDATATEGANALKLVDFTVKDLYNPETNIRIGCWHVNKLMNQFNDVDLVIAAYNGGGGKVKEWLRNKEFSSTGDTLEVIPFKETDKFLKKVKSYYNEYKRLYEKDF